MDRDSEQDFLQLLALKKRFGDLNTALVAKYIEAYGEASLSALARDVALSRDAVRRALQKLSESDR